VEERSVKPIKTKIHQGHDPFLDYTPMAEDMQGWGSTDEAFAEVIGQIRPTTIIEVGTWKGCSAIHMAKTALEKGIPRDQLEIVCVDTWLGSVEHYEFGNLNEQCRKHGRPNFYDQFLSNVIHAGLSDVITPFPMDSINANECFQRWGFKADLIYIDAAHDYNSVKLDAFMWSEILRDGGYMLFDDWHFEPIRRAVHDTFTEEKVFMTGGKATWVR
jgi:hypothetical protein